MYIFEDSFRGQLAAVLVREERREKKRENRTKERREERELGKERKREKKKEKSKVNLSGNSFTHIRKFVGNSEDMFCQRWYPLLKCVI